MPFLLQRVGDDVFVRKNEALVFVLPALIVACGCRARALGLGVGRRGGLAQHQDRRRDQDPHVRHDRGGRSCLDAAGFIRAASSRCFVGDAAIDRPRRDAGADRASSRTATSLDLPDRRHVLHGLALEPRSSCSARRSRSSISAASGSGSGAPPGASCAKPATEQRADADAAEHARRQGLRPGGERDAAPAAHHHQLRKYFDEGDAHARRRRPVLGEC